MLLGGVRGKKKKAGGSTRNKVNAYLKLSIYFISIYYLTFAVNCLPVPSQTYTFVKLKRHCRLCCRQIEEHGLLPQPQHGLCFASQSLNIYYLVLCQLLETINYLFLCNWFLVRISSWPEAWSEDLRWPEGSNWKGSRWPEIAVGSAGLECKFIRWLDHLCFADSRSRLQIKWLVNVNIQRYGSNLKKYHLK